MITLGEAIGSGTRSTVYACGPGRVAKVPTASTPSDWIRFESFYTAAVRAAGAPAPEVFEVIKMDGRLVGVYERIVGPSMWEYIVAHPGTAGEMGRLLAELHAAIFALAPPVTLPRQRDRLAGKIRRAALSIGDHLDDAVDLIPVGHRLQLCHGDLHPGNVLMSENGPVIVDWFDACRGSAVADVARSSLLMGAGGATNVSVRHLRGGSAIDLDELHGAYLSTMSAHLDIDTAVFARWRQVEAAARLAEVGPSADLLAIWRSEIDQLA
jgi:tRNA A-37 threonylcarbamoyl transferase component Bud32